MTPAITLSEAERDTLQRRTLRVLLSGQVLGSAGLGSSVTVGGLIVKDMLHGDSFAGAASAAATVGAALASIPLSNLMRRHGRRPGLQLGYASGMGGALIALFGAERRILAVFLFGSLLFGLGQASNLLARYAAADLARPDARSSAISMLMFGSTFGAVFGPLLVAPAEAVADGLGLWKLTGPYLFSAAFYGLALVNVGIRLRPDPLVLAGGVSRAAESKAPPIRHAIGVIRSIPSARLALAAMVCSQTVMVAVMTMTPIHTKDHGHSVTLTSFVISLHIAGMYALSPLIGRLADQRGRVPMIMVGAAILLGATLLAALAGPAPALLFTALFLLGLGWSCGLVSASSLLTESVPLHERVAVQGSADLLMGTCGAIGGFGSGFVKRAFGYHMLSNLGTVAVLGLLVVAVRYLRRTGPTVAVTSG